MPTNQPTPNELLLLLELCPISPNRKSGHPSAPTSKITPPKTLFSSTPANVSLIKSSDISPKRAAQPSTSPSLELALSGGSVVDPPSSTAGNLYEKRPFGRGSYGKVRPTACEAYVRHRIAHDTCLSSPAATGTRATRTSRNCCCIRDSITRALCCNPIEEAQSVSSLSEQSATVIASGPDVNMPQRTIEISCPS